MHPLQPIPAAVTYCDVPPGPADEWKTSATLEPLPTRLRTACGGEVAARRLCWGHGLGVRCGLGPLVVVRACGGTRYVYYLRSTQQVFGLGAGVDIRRIQSTSYVLSS